MALIRYATGRWTWEKKAGNYWTIVVVFYLIPGLNLLDGIRNIVEDVDVFAMGELAMKNRIMDLFVLHEENYPALTHGTKSQPSQLIMVNPHPTQEGTTNTRMGP